MELQVTITLSDRLFGLLEDKLPNLGRRVEKAITKELSAQARRESNIAVDVTAIEAPAPEPAESEKPRRKHQAKTDAPEVENPEAEAPAAPKPFAEAPVQQPDKPLTEEDIRACMHRTRQRFEGEDYKENTTGEGYKKYHKQLTSQFKQIAAILGADKPSALPVEQRAAFIAECDALIIGEDGNITPPPAPY